MFGNFTDLSSLNIRSTLAAISLLFVTLWSQNARIGDSSGKALLVVPMIGKGTWDDPKRPAIVREAGIQFSYQLSDDGTMALVEALPRNLGESQKLEALVKNDARPKIFRPEKDKKSDVEAEFKRLKKDFDPNSFGRLVPQGAGK